MKSSAETPSRNDRGEITTESVKQDVREALSLFFTPVTALAGIIISAFVAGPKKPQSKAAEPNGDFDPRYAFLAEV
jgi:hypothetical protein